MSETQSNYSYISRKAFLGSVIGATSLILLPRRAMAAVRSTASSPEELEIPSSVLASPDSYIAYIDSMGIGWTEYTLDRDGSLVGNSLGSSIEFDSTLSRAKKKQKVTIGIYIGNFLRDWIIGTVIDGIITAITGQSGSYWASYAAKRLIGKPVPKDKKYHLPCSVYPSHSMEYIRCTQA